MDLGCVIIAVIIMVPAVIYCYLTRNCDYHYSFPEPPAKYRATKQDIPAEHTTDALRFEASPTRPTAQSIVPWSAS